jgi:hypothetical protein
MNFLIEEEVTRRDRSLLKMFYHASINECTPTDVEKMCRQHNHNLSLHPTSNIQHPTSHKDIFIGVHVISTYICSKRCKTLLGSRWT